MGSDKKPPLFSKDFLTQHTHTFKPKKGLPIFFYPSSSATFCLRISGFVENGWPLGGEQRGDFYLASTVDRFHFVSVLVDNSVCSRKPGSLAIASGYPSHCMGHRSCCSVGLLKVSTDSCRAIGCQPGHLQVWTKM